MSSASKILATVLLPEPIPPVIPIRSICLYQWPKKRKSKFPLSLHRNAGIWIPQLLEALFLIGSSLIEVLRPFNRYGSFFNSQVTTRAGFYHYSTILVNFIYCSMNASDGDDLIPFLHIFLKLFGKLGFLCLRSDHK